MKNPFQFDFVSFECPDGYNFEGSTNIPHIAMCHNWDFVYNFDHESKCIRK